MSDEQQAIDFLTNTAKDAAKGLAEESEVYRIAEYIVEDNKALFGTVNTILNKELGISFDVGKDKEIGFMLNPEEKKAQLGFKMKFAEAGIVNFENIAAMSRDEIDNVNLLDWFNHRIETTEGATKAQLRQLKEKLFGTEVELKENIISRRKFTKTTKSEKGILSSVFPEQDVTKITLKDINNRASISKIVDAAHGHQEYERATGKTGARKNKLVTWAVDEKGKIRAGAMTKFFGTLQSQVLSPAYGEQNEASAYKTSQKGKVYKSQVLGGVKFKSVPKLTVNVLQEAMVNVTAAPDKIKVGNNLVLNRDKIFAQLRLTTGIRVQDLMRLHKDDIKNGFVTITSLKSKSNTYETVDRPISEATEKLLRSLADNVPSERGFLFVSNFEQGVQGERIINNAAKTYSKAGNDLINASKDAEAGIRITDKGKERRLHTRDFRKYIATLAKKKLQANPELRKAIMGQVGEVAEKGMSVIDNYYILDELPKGTKITPEWKAAMEQLDNLVFSEIDMNEADKERFFNNVKDVKVKTVIEGEEKPIKKQIKKIKKEAKPNIITDANIEASKGNALHLANTSSATAGTVVGTEPKKVPASKNSINRRFGNKNKIKAGVALATAVGSTGLKAATLLTPTPIDIPITLGMIAYGDIKDPHEFAELYPEEHLSWNKGKELDKLDSDITRSQFTGPRARVINKKQINKLKNKRRILEDDLKRRGYDKNTALALGKNIKEDIFEERKIQKFDIADPTVDPMISGYLQETKGYEEKLKSQMSSLMNE